MELKRFFWQSTQPCWRLSSSTEINSNCMYWHVQKPLARSLKIFSLFQLMYLFCNVFIFGSEDCVFSFVFIWKLHVSFCPLSVQWFDLTWNCSLFSTNSLFLEINKNAITIWAFFVLFLLTTTSFRPSSIACLAQFHCQSFCIVVQEGFHKSSLERSQTTTPPTFSEKNENNSITSQTAF